jgi:RNA polymerase sigma-70 factor (ECF subfamily)
VIRRALEGLDAHKREVLELAYWQGLSQSEIAEKLKTPLGTVKSWTRQALRDLKLALPEGGES